MDDLIDTMIQQQEEWTLFYLAHAIYYYLCDEKNLFDVSIDSALANAGLK